MNRIILSSSLLLSNVSKKTVTNTLQQRIYQCYTPVLFASSLSTCQHHNNNNNTTSTVVNQPRPTYANINNINYNNTTSLISACQTLNTRNLYNPYLFNLSSFYATQRYFSTQTNLANTNNSSQEVDVPFVDATQQISSTTTTSDNNTNNQIKEKIACSRYRMLPSSPRKLMEYCKWLKGLGVSEALTQLSLSPNTRAIIFYNAIRNAMVNAIHDHQMNKDRLYISQIWVNKDLRRRSWIRRGRGNVGVIIKQYSRLYVYVKEQPVSVGEVRVGRAGRKHETIARTKERLARFQSLLTKQKQ